MYCNCECRGKGQRSWPLFSFFKDKNDHTFNNKGQNSTKCKLKGELHHENKLISYERALKMLENDMCITGIGQAILELLSFEVGSRNHQTGISLPQKFSEIFGNMRLVLPKMTSHLTNHNFVFRYTAFVLKWLLW